MSDVDLFEINEAFAAQSVAILQELSLDPAKVGWPCCIYLFVWTYGMKHKSCLISSPTEILGNRFFCQRNFLFDSICIK